MESCSAPLEACDPAGVEFWGVTPSDRQSVGTVHLPRLDAVGVSRVMSAALRVKRRSGSSNCSLLRAQKTNCALAGRAACAHLIAW
jgi:hypothetical protein